MNALSGYAKEFERRARAFFAARPTLRHEWREFPSGWSADRLDLVVVPPRTDVPEVWATLYARQITVGIGSDHADFEAWGRRMTDDEVGAEAWRAFETALQTHGYLHETIEAPAV